jgi:hypothetical protein
VIKLKDIMPPGYVKAEVPKKLDFDRNAFYEQYVTNVLPSNFTIKRVDDKIIIQVKDD